MAVDQEVKAIGELAQALEPLSEEERARVLEWACDRYGTAVKTNGKHEPTGGAGPADDQEQTRQFDAFADLYNAASPSTDTTRVLVGGYWFQQIAGEADFGAQQVNNELKHLGHAVANVTTAFDGLIERKPQLAMQVRKGGTTRQARKKYKLTTEGIKMVERMIRGEDGEQK